MSSELEVRCRAASFFCALLELGRVLAAIFPLGILGTQQKEIDSCDYALYANKRFIQIA